MAGKIDWLTEMHRIAGERKGAVTAADEARIREMMKIPNNEVSIEDVEFKRYRSHF